MTYKQIIKTTLLLTLIIFILTSCDKNGGEHKIDIKIDKVIIYNNGQFSFQDSLTYIVKDTSVYRIKFSTVPDNADIYYSKNINDFIKLTEKWISVDSTFKTIKFYASGENYNKTEINTLDFGFGKDSLVKAVDLYPNPCQGNINFEFNCKNIRGNYNYKIYDLAGRQKMTKYNFISNDTIHGNIDLDNLSSGIYIIGFEFGNTDIFNKIVKK